jgi:hypothetical protein
MNKNKFINSVIKIALVLFISLQAMSEFHLHLDDHDHSDEHECIICHISVTSFVPNTHINSILISFIILLITFNYSPALTTNNYNYSFTSRSPPLL